MWYNKVKAKSVLICLMSFLTFLVLESGADLTMVSYILRGDGLGQLSVGLITMLAPEFTINFISSRSLGSSSLVDVSPEVCTIFKKQPVDSAPVALFIDM